MLVDQRGTTSPRFRTLLVVLLLSCYFGVTIGSKFGTCTTYDEFPHLTNGFSFWATGDYRLGPESILLQRWASLPAVLGGYRFPDLDQPSWWASNNWEIAHQFAYESGNDPDRLLLGGRIMIALLGTMLGLVVFLWSQHYFGTIGGLVSLLAFVCCPNMLAHGGLVTTDVGTSLFFSLSVIGLWSVLHRLTLGTLAGSTFAVGGLLLAKMSGVLIVPMGLALLAIRLWGGRPLIIILRGKTRELRGRLAVALAATGLVAAHVLVAWALIWALFAFRFETFPEYRPDRDLLWNGSWDEVLDRGGTVSAFVRWARDLRLLPEAYLYSLASSLRNTQTRPGFLNGEISMQGWRAFFPFCFLVKTPVPTLLLLVVAAVTWGREWWTGERNTRGRRLADSLYRSAPLWVLVGVYGTVAILSPINIGHRHLLPIYPAILTWVGATGVWLRPPTWKSLRFRAAVPACLTMGAMLWLVGETVYRWPHYLAYFNQFVGGPANGYRHLVDSSLDWGQDLPGLKRWLDREGMVDKNQVYFAYFGTGHPERHGVHSILLPGRGYFERREKLYLHPWKAGVYCISATILQGVYISPYGRWNETAEQDYQALRQQVQLFTSTRDDPEARRKLIEFRGAEEWQNTIVTYDEHRISRLCAFLRQRRPDDNVGYSILIYRLTDDDLDRALNGPSPE